MNKENQQLFHKVETCVYLNARLFVYAFMLQSVFFYSFCTWIFLGEGRFSDEVNIGFIIQSRKMRKL